MPDELIPITPTPELDIPNPRPYLIGATVGTALIYVIVNRFLKTRSDGAVWDSVTSVTSEIRAPRQWTSAFRESDGFLAQLKDITPTEPPK